nr:MAG TPA: hypothetical protein [Caudoviricetes sp.]
MCNYKERVFIKRVSSKAGTLGILSTVTRPTKIGRVEHG